MLDVLRNSAKSWVAKVLLVLLVLSFGVWGISGTVFQGAGNTVVTVGETRVTQDEFRLAYGRQVAALSRQTGTRLTREQARAFGVEQNVLVQVAMNAALDEQSRRMNLGLSEGRLAKLIAEDPAFQGIDGRFDRATFANLLRNVDMTEEDFIVSQEQTAIRQQIVEAISDGYEAPTTLLQAINRFQNETRTLDYVVLNPDIVGTIADPAGDVLTAYFEGNKQTYRAPEYRKIEYVTLRASDITDPASVADDAVRADYETYADRYRKPETRTIEQLSFADADAAKAAADKLAGGESFEDLISAESKTMSDVLLGTFERQAIPDQLIADAAFGISLAGATSGVVEGTFGPVILRVTSITPESTKNFEDVADSIRNDLALAEAEAILLDVHDAYEDARAGGETLQEAAKKQKLSPVIIEAVDRTAQTPDGDILRDLPESRQLLANAFDTDINVETAPIGLGTDGFMWFEVLDIISARDRTLDEVRDRVVEDWKRQQAATALGKLATELQKRVRDGEVLTAVAADQGLVTEIKYDIRRQDEDAVLGAAAIAAAFGGPDGLVAVADDAGGSAKILMQVTGITTPDASSVSSLPEATQQALSRRMGDDMLTQAIVQMQGEFGVSYDPAVVEQAISRSR
ncbi:MAG: peptidylprolyl isomerase [Hyphomicrobiales bacterium]|nr:peptidylprolyl isomerase [Hyphomicrobiales bacterium]MCP5000123.1 peptidylprolyl isomerase [Hyphomicrobiales bacterium]